MGIKAMSDDITAYVAAEALMTPQPWEDGGKVHNWRNHVGEHTKALWDTFTDAQKIAIAGDADDKASREEWE